MSDKTEGLAINRRRSARLLSKDLEAAKLDDVNKGKEKKQASTPKKQGSALKKEDPTVKPPVAEKRKESLAARILRENNNLLGNVSKDDSHLETTAGEDETFNCSSESEIFFSSGGSGTDSDYEQFSFGNRSKKSASENGRAKRSLARSTAKEQDEPSTSKAALKKPAVALRKPAAKMDEDKSDNDEAEAGPSCFAKFSTSFLTNYLEKMSQPNAEKLHPTLFDTMKPDTKFTMESSMKPEAVDMDASSSDGDDGDDWLEMEKIDEAAVEEGDKKASVQVTIKQPVKKTKAQLEAERWMNEIRLEIARRRRALHLNMHRMHVLCYIGHLRFHVGAVVQKQSELAALLSDILPAEILAFCPAAMDKAVRMFRPIFRLCSSSEAKKLFVAELKQWKSTKKDSNAKSKKKPTDTVEQVGDFAHVYSVENYGRYLSTLILHKCFTSNLDLAVIFFAFCHCVLKLSTRLCVSFNPIPKTELKKNGKPDVKEAGTKTPAKLDTKTKTPAKNENKPSTTKKRPQRSKAADGSPSKLMEMSKKDAKNLTAKRKSLVETAEKKPIKRRSVVMTVIHEDEPEESSAVKKKTRTSISDLDFSDSELEQLNPRDYWVEFYDELDRRWICVDLAYALVDRPKKIEKHAAQPMLYVMAVDNEMGTREIAAKYAADFMSTKFRRLRIEQEWLDNTLNLPLLKANNARALAEDAQIRTLQLNQDKPITVAEYKNHPLYVLDKDLLKFEAIYPPDTQPLGEIRGYKIFPRSAVFTLQGELNWIKEARKLKADEKPYKVVKARPKFTDRNIPKEERTQLYLNVYGYWQTEPYIPPPVIDGKIPRNEHGNIYLYKKTMLPKGCAHLKLNGLLHIARRMELEAVPAVTGWEFTGGKNHPILEGCVVLKKDVDVLKSAWEDFAAKRAEKEAKKAEERVWTNWKTLIKGKLLLEKMRTRFK